MTKNAPLSLLCFGEVLWDVFPFGEHIGGAAFNLAAHASRCGLRSFLVSRIGNDVRGDRARGEIERRGVDGKFLQVDPERPTGWVGVELRDGQPTYRIARDVAWDAIEAPASGDLREEHFAALVCGTLAQRSSASRKALQALRRDLPQVPVFYDVNLRGEETPLDLVRATLPGVRWLKVNEEEARLLAGELFGGDLSARELAAALVAEFGIDTLLLTRGSKGCEIISSEECVTIEARPVPVASAVGAGDAFSAAFLAGVLQGRLLEESARRAASVAEWVVSRPEAIPEYPPELARLFDTCGESLTVLS